MSVLSSLSEAKPKLDFNVARAAFDPGRVETFFESNNSRQPGVMDLRRPAGLFLLHRVLVLISGVASGHADDLNGHTARAT